MSSQGKYIQKRNQKYPCMYVQSAEKSFYDGIKMCSLVFTCSKITTARNKTYGMGLKRGVLKTPETTQKEKLLIREYLQNNITVKLPDAETHKFLDFGSGAVSWAGAFPNYEDRLEIIELMGTKTYQEAKKLIDEQVKVERKLKREIKKHIKNERLNSALSDILEKEELEDEEKAFDIEHERFLKETERFSFKNIADAANGLIKNIYN